MIGNDPTGKQEILSDISVVDGLHDVPSANSTDNDQMRDVVGNKDDYVGVPYSEGESSILGFLHTGYYHTHGASFIYPDKADPVTLTANAASWNDTGSKVEIIPASTITKNFDLHWASITDISENCYGIIDIFAGGAGSEVLIGSVDCTRTSNFSQEGNKPTQIPQQPANTRISARLSSSTTNATTCKIKFYGHVYSDSLT